MRASKSRSRSKMNRNRFSGANVVNRIFDSSGPDGKVRGTPQQIVDKYGQLARDAQLGNDRVAAENFMQHAEHYRRILGDAQREQEARREEQDRLNRERQAERGRDRAEWDASRGNADAGSAANSREGASSEFGRPPKLDRALADGMKVQPPSEKGEGGLVDIPETNPATPHRLAGSAGKSAPVTK